jgi:hypothetical protein|tara:strand:+ start:264 stop:716 length:453 start_codon:yes stop_codon:yes gene_type:complete
MVMNAKSVDIVLEDIAPTKEQLEELYDQLKRRSYSISHGFLPQYEDHIEFVKNHPYRAWFMIKQVGGTIGNVYVQYDNSIGLNCVDDITEVQIKNILHVLTSKLTPLDAAPSVRSGDFFLNVSASNAELQDKLKNIGLSEIQKSFCLVKD